MIKNNYSPSSQLVIIVGNYGSGKTEVAVNLAVKLKASGKKVSIADLDIVNPYFRCREALDTMEGFGIRVVVPRGEQHFGDLPIIMPEIKGMLRPTDGEISIFDVGGDDVGATPLSSLVEALGDQPYSLLQVINSRRPFTNTVEGCLKMKETIESSSRLKVSGLVVNSHLLDETTPEIIMEGVDIAHQVSSQAGVPIEFVAAMSDFIKSPEISDLKVPILKLERIMLPPWLLSEQKKVSSVGKKNE
ncbi:MAG: cobalamin biosynthesis protein CbiA [Proteobacteria bacterium]|nr:cobalamin biosynthesis protein CbiA [Pseudomonadota bacterium]